MARCWTCDSSVNGYRYTCSSCQDTAQELQGLRQSVEDLGSTQTDLLNRLSNRLSEISTIVEWGFEEVDWRLSQLGNTLRSIDETLKTPSQTQANEWRVMAEELRRRGDLEHAERLFSQALENNPLDYRIYIGLAKTHLRKGEFDEALTFLEKSLPHAPIGEIDYRSYSYRLIARIHGCNENYVKAFEALHASLKLSPDYADGAYDFAQYLCLVSDADIARVCSQTFLEWGGNWARGNYNLVCWLCLQKAINKKPIYFYLAGAEKNFASRGETVRKVLENLMANAVDTARATISLASNVSKEVQKMMANLSRRKAEKPATLEAVGKYNEALLRLVAARKKLDAKDYLEALEAGAIAKGAEALITEAQAAILEVLRG